MATFNARAETVETRPVFRDAFKRSRCLIPISGYYEWQDTSSGKQPWYFTAADGSPLVTVAGLWDEWKNRETGERLKSCTMIVGEPNPGGAVVDSSKGWFLDEHWAHYRAILAPVAIHHGYLFNSAAPDEENVNERVHWSVIAKRGGRATPLYNPPNN